MKELEKGFVGRGEVRNVNFNQIMRSENAYLYELIENQNGSKRYEVFEKKIQNESEYVMGGKTIKIENKVLYPRSTDFGIWAWCFADYQRALNKFQNLNNC